MRRFALFVPVVLAGTLALAGCSGGGPAGQAAGKSSGSASSTQPTSSAHGTPGKVVNPATVVDGMHYVQLFGTVDPVLAQMADDSVGGTVPAATELKNAASSLRQFAAQSRGLPSAGSARRTLDQLAAASSTLAGQLTSLAAKGSQSSDSAALNSALARFHSAAAAARRAAGLPAVVTPRKPQADTGSRAAG
jgi:hypothetical protein